jgi:uncharacterized protein YlzI (FlbEa/FlbD family)
MIELAKGPSLFSSPLRRVLCALCVRSLIFVALLAVLILAARGEKNKLDISKIHGRIQYVNSFPDYKVQAVTSFPDLRVQIVTSFPDKPGQWQIVDSFPDYKIEMVNSFPDFTIEFVTSFPGPAK